MMEDLQKVPKNKPGRPPRREIVHRIRHTKEAKEKAARYYLLGLSLPEISKLLDGTPIRTLEKWQLAGKWTELRNPENIHAKVLQLVEAGKTKKEISILVNRDQSTIYRWIKEIKEKKNLL